MFQRIVPDSHAKGRWIAYTASSICVLIDQELRSLSDLLGWRSLSSRSQDVLRHEVHAFQETLFCRAGASPSPSLEGLFPQGSPYFIARSVALASVCCVSLAPIASALPTGYQSVSGDVQFAQTGDTLNVTTGAQKAIATYQSFNVAGHETVNFNLPNSRSAILNRVTGGDASQIMGRVNSNGQVYMVNTAGIVFGQGAQVNVGGLHASTLNITDADFMAETQHFKQEGAGAAITNQGVISGGDVTLIGSVIDNQGTISVPGGQANLAVGDNVTMVVDDGLAVSVTVDEGLKSAVQGYTTAIQNSGSISATEGVIALQAKLQGGLYNKAINNDGVIEALGLGDVVLTAHSTSQDAVVRNAGQIDVSGHLSTANGGDLTLDSDYLIQRGELKAEGAENGVGGHIYLTSTQGTLLTSGSLTSAKGAGGDSTAGDVVIWSDKNTYFRQGAVIDVSGGALSGDAGFVEVSGKENVYFQGQARGYAANGQAGRILIDPIDIIISNAGGDTVDGGDAVAAIDETFAEGNATETYNPQAGGSFAGFGDIWLQATNDITINSAFDTNTATGNAGVSLRLEANNNININANVTTHNAPITITADADGNGVGDFINNVGTVETNFGSLNISAHNILFNMISTSGGGSGNITLTATGTINDLDDTGANLHALGLTMTSNGGIGNTTAQGINCWINLDLTVPSTGGNDLILTAGTSIPINSISTGGAGNISLTTTGFLHRIYDLDDVGDNISTTGTLTLSASDRIGFGSALNINTGNVTVLSSTGQDIWITDSGALTVEAIATGGAGNITLTGTSINDTDVTDDDTSNITTTGNIILTATTGSIGNSTNELDVNAGVGASALRATNSTAGQNIYIQDTSGNISLDNISSASTVSFKAEGLTLPAGKTIGTTGNLYLYSDSLDIAGTASTSNARIYPLTPSNTIGLAGGVGVLDLTQTELLNLFGVMGSLFIGDPVTTTSNVDVGNLNLSSKIINLTVRTSGNITDTTPANDATANITVNASSDIFLIGGSVGSTGLGDLDIGTHSRVEVYSLADAFIGGTGNLSFDVIDSVGNASINSAGFIFFDIGALAGGTLTLTAGTSISESSFVINAPGGLLLTSNGSISLSDLDVGDITVTSSGGNTITLVETGAMTISSITTGGAGIVTLTGTSINDTDITDDDTANITTTGSVVLTASTGSIGSSTNELDINTGVAASGLKATATSGDIYIQETAGNVSLDTSQASGTTGVVRLKTAAAATLTLADTKTLSGTDITLLTDSLTIGTASASLSATASGTIRIAPITDNTGIGLGGGAGALSIADNEFSRMTAGTIVIGQDTTSGAMDIGSVDLSAELTHLTLKTTGAITDNNTASDATANIILGANKNLTITGGGGSGSGAIGTVAANGDIDITTAGTGYVDIATNNADIFLTDTASLYANLITSGSGDITLTGTNIYDTDVTDDNTANIITSGNIILTATTNNIGSWTNELDLDAGIGASAIKATNLTGGKIIALQEVSGVMNLDDILAGAAVSSAGVHLKASDIVLATGKSISTDTLELRADTMQLDGSITYHNSSNFIYIDPLSSNVTVGLGGGVGSLNLTDTELDKIHPIGSTKFVYFGRFQDAGNIDIGAISGNNFVSVFELNGSGTLTDGSVGDDSVDNISSYNTVRLYVDSVGTAGLGDLDVLASTSLEAITTNDTYIQSKNPGTLIFPSLSVSSGSLYYTLSDSGSYSLSAHQDIFVTGTGLVASTVTATVGDVVITSTSSISSTDITAGGSVTVSSLGNISLNAANAGNDMTFTTLTGSITLDSIGSAQAYSAENITLTAATGINILNAGTVLLAQGTGSATTSFDDNAGTASIPVVTTGMTIDANGTGGIITVNGELASVGTLRAYGTDSDVSIAYTGSNLDLTNVTINASPGTNGVINLVGDTNSANDGTLDAQNATGTGAVTISTTGAYNISGTGLNILANSVSLTSGNTLTLSGDFNASSLDASTVGSLNLTDTASDLMLGTLSAGSTVDLTTNVGDITLTGTVSGTTVTLDSNGHILDGNVGATDIIATAGGTLDAGGWIGTWANPLEIQISGGTLGIRPLGLTGGISTVINGSVAPVDTLTLLNNPLGQVWYNGVMLWPIAPPPSSGGGSVWFDDLTGGDWNAFRYPSEIYRDDVAEDYLEARLLHSRVLTEKNPQLMNRYIVPRILDNGVLYQQEWARSVEYLQQPSDDAVRDALLGEFVPLRTSLLEVHDETELDGLSRH